MKGASESITPRHELLTGAVTAVHQSVLQASRYKHWGDRRR
jgi:hypothetical protein